MSVLFLFWAFENARMTNHWFLVATNSFVHILVYGYFACSTLGYVVRWKKYITLLQVVVVALVAVVVVVVVLCAHSIPRSLFGFHWMRDG
jgi:predicted alpha/beta hydrolase